MAAQPTPKWTRIRRFFRLLWAQIHLDHISDMAAMLTYYAMLALFPMMLFALTVALLVIPREVVDEGVGMATRAVPRPIAPLVREHAARLTEAASGGFAVLGALLALFAGSRGVKALSVVLNRTCGLEERRPWWKVELTMVAVTLAGVLLACIALGLLIVGPWLGARLALGPTWTAVWDVGRWVGAAVLMMVLWGLIYKYLPDGRQAFHWLTPGAAVGVLLWLGATQLFALYVANFGRFEKTYGTLGAVILFLNWLWVSNIALLLGGEINDALADEVRKERQPVTEMKDLARTLGDDLTALARDHIELAKIEASEQARQVAMGIAARAIIVLVALVGFAMLCATVAVALAPLVPPLWLRMLIMSIVYLLVGEGVHAAWARSRSARSRRSGPESTKPASEWR